MTRVRAWLRANRWALAALAVLATASTWYAFTIDWQQYQDGNPTRLLDVPRDKQAEYGPGIFSLRSVVVLEGGSEDGRQYGVTDGTDVVVVDLTVTPDPEGDPEAYLPCDLRLVAPSPAGERLWWPESSNPTSYPESATEIFGCNVAGGDRYVYRQYFVVPAGGATAGAVQVTIQEELPLALRLRW